MLKHRSLLGLILIWGIGSGLGLKYSVPLMKNISDTSLIILSAAIPLMYLPGVLAYVWKNSIWWVLIVQILISLLAALISTYYVDTILSYALLGFLSLIIIYVSSLFSNSLKKQISSSFGMAFLIFTIANIYGHNLSDGNFGLLIKIIAATALSFIVCFFVTTKILKL